MLLKSGISIKSDKDKLEEVQKIALIEGRLPAFGQKTIYERKTIRTRSSSKSWPAICTCSGTCNISTV